MKNVIETPHTLGYKSYQDGELITINPYSTLDEKQDFSNWKQGYILARQNRGDSMEPTEKSQRIEIMLTSLTGVNRPNTIRANRCVFGNMPGTHDMNLRDDLSRNEYRISGMCQTCQDSVFRKK